MAASPTPTRSPRPQGSVVDGRYAILKKLGSGSLGTVYLAQDLAQNRRVALKVLRRAGSDEACSRLRNEFRAIAQLRHPRIAAAYDLSHAETSGAPYYTREYVTGEPLAAGPPLHSAPAEFLKPILDLLEALETIHLHGILHLDIHAGNLIVAEDVERGSVLIDFDLVRSVAAEGAKREWPSDAAAPPSS